MSELITEEIKSEFAIADDGKTTVSLRGASRLLGVEHSTLVRAFQGGVKNQGKLSQLLSEHGFQVVSFSSFGIPDTAFSLVAYYYATEAGARCTQEAKVMVKAFIAIGFRKWIHRQLDWHPSNELSTTESVALKVMSDRIEQLETRLIASFKEVAQEVVSSISKESIQKVTEEAADDAIAKLKNYHDLKADEFRRQRERREMEWWEKNGRR